MLRIELQPAYVLHARPYRDTSLLVDFFTPSLGRVTAVARGVRQRKSRNRSLLNPFVRLLISLQGKSDLKLLTAVEENHHSFLLQGEALFSGFYLNELLMRVLPEQDAQEQVFTCYQQSLAGLQVGEPLEPVLRAFELALLKELGYAPDFSQDAETGRAIKPDQEYYFEWQRGFIPAGIDTLEPRIKGEWILQLAVADFSDPACRQAAKYLCRKMLAPLLGSRPLKSRELFTLTSQQQL